MTRGTPRRRGRAGATFTLVALATSMLLLVSAGVFLRSAGQLVELAGLEGRRSAAREAAFAGVAWAARDAQARARTAGQGVLDLHGGRRVHVRYSPADGGGAPDLVVVVEVATPPGDAPVALVATLAPRDAGYVLVRFD